MTIYIQGPHGLGDNIYQRAALNVLRERRDDPIYVKTPWPELLPAGVLPARPNSSLRTQAKNERRIDPAIWHPWPHDPPVVSTTYSSRHFERGSILQAMAASLGIDRVRMDLPAFPAWPVVYDKPIAVVRPATVRREWSNPARNPDPHALAYLAGRLRETHHVIAVADLEFGEEFLVEPMPPHDEAYLSGELSMPRLFGLCQSADLVAGGVGWLVPFALAARAQALILLGGHGGHNAPEKILGPLAPVDHRITFIYPSDFCMCTNMRHGCRKDIPQARIDEALEAVR